MYKCAGDCPHQASSLWMTSSATKLSLFFLPVCEIIFVGACSSPFRQPAEFIFWKFYISHRHCLVVARVPNFGFGNVLFGGGIFSICWRNLQLEIYRLDCNVIEHAQRQRLCEEMYMSIYICACVCVCVSVCV